MAIAASGYADISKRLGAAQQLLLAPTTTAEKIKSLRTILAGIHPQLEAKFAEVESHLGAVENVIQGDIISLAADQLPEVTEEDKRRKKVFLLFLKSWNDLKSEVARVQAEMQQQQSGAQTGSSMWMRILKRARGPLALVTVIAVGIAIMSQTSVDITIENHGCGTLYASSGVPVSIPGLKIPNEELRSGGSVVATIPSLPVTVDGTDAGSLKIKAVGFNFSIELSNAVTNVTFDGVSLLGKSTDISLSSARSHTLSLVCE
jgi:hypothetical protein